MIFPALNSSSGKPFDKALRVFFFFGAGAGAAVSRKFSLTAQQRFSL